MPSLVTSPVFNVDTTTAGSKEDYECGGNGVCGTLGGDGGDGGYVPPYFRDCQSSVKINH